MQTNKVMADTQRDNGMCDSKALPMKKNENIDFGVRLLMQDFMTKMYSSEEESSFSVISDKEW